ncbi:hypothetical protein RHGRI_018905 [Rhododendron griersonianum]|uniref:Serine-threonine/tyrosine-protein kinase catalytic domain-containing protein n=1 Tax=Rhododendron griersonianum TaxID=479676 RepID=A0AAV6K3C5_9ERIC|nr:hypothetical protein RHGRI_018905 [Rhododendron griersonianum]
MFDSLLPLSAGGIVNNTLRPSIPSFCDAEWRRLMEQCWAPNPVARPSFTEIASRLRVMEVGFQRSVLETYWESAIIFRRDFFSP